MALDSGFELADQKCRATKGSYHIDCSTADLRISAPISTSAHSIDGYSEMAIGSSDLVWLVER